MLPKQEDNTCPYCEELKRQLVIVQQENQKLRYEVERLRKALENVSFNAAREDYKPCVHAEQNAICLCAKRSNVQVLRLGRRFSRRWYQFVYLWQLPGRNKDP